MRDVVARVPSEDRAGREEAGSMLDESQLRLMSPEQRARLARTLAALDRPRPDPKARLRRKLALAVVLACCVFLAAWIGVLAVTLPSHYRAGGWRGAWVGFDVVELFGFAAVAWTAWRGKQLLVVALIVTSTLLCCDAWFDLTLDWGTHGFSFAVFSAVCGELPLALLMILGARRLLRLTIATAMAAEGVPGPVPPLWRVPLISTVHLDNAQRSHARLAHFDKLPRHAAGAGAGDSDQPRSAEGVGERGGDERVGEPVAGFGQPVRQHPRAGQ
jgi:hypothetical protein